MPKIKEYTQLLCGCYRTEISVIPTNWNTKAAKIIKGKKPVEWMIWYRFHDPAHRDKYPNGKLVKIRGMNTFKNLEQRQKETRGLFDLEVSLIDNEHYNPITEQYMTPPVPVDEAGEVIMPIPEYTEETTTREYLILLTGHIPQPSTPFISALWMGLARTMGVPIVINDIGSIIRGVEQAAKTIFVDVEGAKAQLNTVQIQHVRKKHIKLILEKCGQINPKFSNARHNRYIDYLRKIFKPLVSLEAIEMNPVTDIEDLPVIKGMREVLTDQERTRIDEHLHKNHYTFWRLLQVFFHSGARETEIMTVRDMDVDIANQRYKILIKKGKVYRWVWKVIKDIALPYWEELMGEVRQLRLQNQSDPFSKAPIFLFSKFLEPGYNPIRPDQIGRRWAKYVMDDKTGLGIKKRFYGIKHLHTTELMDILSQGDAAIEKAEKEVAEHNSHTTTAMLQKVYDIDNQERKGNRVKSIQNSFA